MRVLYFVFLFVVLIGCSQTTYEMNTTFNASEVAFINQKGSGQINGQAFLTRNDGIVVYAAGQEVRLIPSGKYADERFKAIYGDRKITRNVPNFSESNSEYVSMIRQTKANGEGRFAFKELADGRYHVTVKVIWKAGDAYQGGALTSTVIIKDGQTIDLIMNGV